VLAGNYTVKLAGDKNGIQDEQTLTIRVNPAPAPMLSAERIHSAIPLYRFATAIQPNETAMWSFSDGTNNNGNVVEHLFRNEGNSTARLTLKNNFGCVTSVEESYDLEEFNLLAPDAFTPNNDGINETFVPVALTVMNKAFSMNIQNPRTGEVVYQTTNPNEGWNGTMNNQGQKLEAGVYIWTVALEENIVENRVFNGKIKLQR